MTKQTFTKEIGGKTLAIEVSQMAGQANAAVLAHYGNTVVLGTAVMSKEDSSANYLPLRVDYEERFYAAGKILGSRFMRREGRPSEDAILTGRLIDRTLRPLFNQNIRRDIQVVVTVLAYDEAYEPDFVSLMAASTALAISDIPWNGPVGGVRIAKIGDAIVVNPTNEQVASPACVFETFASGPQDLINMIELAGTEGQEADILAAFTRAQEEINGLIGFVNSIVEKIGKPKTAVSLFTPDADLKAKADAYLASRLDAAIYRATKAEQEDGIALLEKELIAHIKESMPDASEDVIHFLFEAAVEARVHENTIEKQMRIDGRAVTKLRDLDGSVGLFERTHGSAFFARGTTQSLAVTTLASPGQEQLIESMQTNTKRRFMLHYNFPPYSVGEVGSFRGPGRREIGHGALAEKALRPMIPTADEFPYAIRVVSEILSSNGSSSMATVCASTLSLMDAGVPLKKPIAGIAMGLMLNESTGAFQVVTDLAGLEDHYGDMDFKVAGTRDGVNAIQLDVKVRGLTMAIITETLARAKDARFAILDFMQTVLPEPRKERSPYAPAIVRMAINPEKIGMVIGPGGKMINGMIKDFGLIAIDIEEDGTIFIAADSVEKTAKAQAMIASLTREYKVGEIVEGPVIKILDFGAIVDLGGGKDGMVHVSELKEGFVKQVSDVVKVGDFLRVKIIRVEDGHIGLSLKRMGPTD
jgi:polyribonucleotide nucleotidyltransferase